MDAMPGIIPLGVPSKSTDFSRAPALPWHGRHSRNNPDRAPIGLPCTAREFPIPIGSVFWYPHPCSRGIPCLKLLPPTNFRIIQRSAKSMDKLIETILETLKSRHQNKAFCHSGFLGKPDVGKSKQAPFYFRNRKDNLIGFPDDEHKVQICQGSGREWDKDIFALRSSCALAFNLFGNGPVRFCSGSLPISGTFSVQYEKQLPTLRPIENKSRTPANLDVYLESLSGGNTIVFFEIKKLEWLTNNSRPLSARYLKQKSYKATVNQNAISAFVKLFSDISIRENRNCRFKRYDAFQMSKHLLGIYNHLEARKSNSSVSLPNVLLVNCIWEFGSKFKCSIVPERLLSRYNRAVAQETNEFAEFCECIQPVLSVFRDALGTTMDVKKVSVQTLIEQMERTDIPDWKKRLITSNCL